MGAAIDELRRQQRALAAAITDDRDHEVGDLLRTTGHAGRVDGNQSTGSAGATLIGLYRHAYRARLVEALRQNYPVVHRVLGDDGFSAIGRAFLDRHPSTTRSIRWFGSNFEAFLREVGADLAHPSIPDLARMEWALSLAFDAQDAPVWAFAELVQLAPEHWPELPLRAHPSCQLVPLEWAVEPVWRALTDSGDASVEPPLPHRHDLIVYRKDDETQWRSIEPHERRWLRLLLEGSTFGDLCDQILRAPPGDIADDCAKEGEAHDQAAWAAGIAAGMLRGWVDAGLLCRVDRPTAVLQDHRA